MQLYEIGSKQAKQFSDKELTRGKHLLYKKKAKSSEKEQSFSLVETFSVSAAQRRLTIRY